MDLHRIVFLLTLLAGPLYAINVREVGKETTTVRGDLTVREMAQTPSPAPQTEAHSNEKFNQEIEALHRQCAKQDQKIQELTGTIQQQKQTLSELKHGAQNIKEKVDRYIAETYQLKHMLQQNTAYTSFENDLYYWSD